MKTVICTDPKDYNLTIDRPYVTRQEDDNAETYELVNDRGLVRNYSSSLFRDFVPEPIIRQLTDEEIIESISLDYGDDNDRDVSITFSTIEDSENGRNNITLNWEYASSTTDISCGIRQLYDIDNLIYHINNIAQLNDKNDVKILLFIKAIQAASSSDDNCAFHILSTTTNTIGIYREAMDSISLSNHASHNPNSGNAIVIWTMLKV